MAMPYAKPFYSSKEWCECQAAFMLSKNYMCERCGGIACIVHHIIHITPENITNPNITLNWDNLMAVCLDCHNRLHGKGSPCIDGLRFDDDGNLIQSPPGPLMKA